MSSATDVSSTFWVLLLARCDFTEKSQKQTGQPQQPPSPSPPSFPFFFFPLRLKWGQSTSRPLPSSQQSPSPVCEEWRWLKWSCGNAGVEAESLALAQNRNLRGQTKAEIDPGRTRWWNLPPAVILIPVEDGSGRRKRQSLKEERKREDLFFFTRGN